MKKFNKIAIVLVLLVLLLASGSAKELVIIYTNDFHGQLLPFETKAITGEFAEAGGAAYISSVIKELRNSYPTSSLLLMAGDIAQGTPISNFFKGEPVVKVMNIIGYDACVLGNHEFDWGQEALNQMIESSNFPWLCANLITTTNEDYYPGVKPYIIKELNGMKVAIIGLITDTTPSITKKDNVAGLEFLSEEEVTKDLIADISAREKPDMIVVLSHLGIEADRKLAEKVEGIDIIVGGHTHATLKQPEKVGNTIIVQAGSKGVWVGLLKIDFSTAEHKIVSYQGELIPVLTQKIAPDEEVAKVVDEYNGKVAPVMERKIGEIVSDLERSNFGESSLGDFITDVMREVTDSDVAFQNNGGIRADLLKGPVTVGNIYEVCPFDNAIVTMDLTGEEIMEILEQSIYEDNIKMQISGLKVVIDPKNKEGSKIVEVKVGNNPLEKEKVYRVTTNDFLSLGGDGYKTFMQGKNLVYGSRLTDVLIEYIEKNSPIDWKKDGRIKVLLND